MVGPKFAEQLKARVSEALPLIQVLLGPRQVGKSTAATEIFNSFAGSKIMVTADGPISPNQEWLETEWMRARSLIPPVLLIIDEVQKISGWSEVVKKLFDEDRGKRDLRVVLLGSSSLALQQGLTESLAGRFELLRAHHWNLDEMKSGFGFELESYLRFGGYPGAARYVQQPSRWQAYLRDSIVEPVLSRDILMQAEVRKPALFRQTFEIAMRYPAQQVSYQKLVGQLQERGSTETVKNYLELFEGAFLLSQIFQYSTRPLSTRTSSPKLIPSAPALVHAFVDPARIGVDPEWRGRVFESVVGSALVRLGHKVFTWSEQGAELDFVVVKGDSLFAIEVKSGRHRNATGIRRFLRHFPHAKPIVVTPENVEQLLGGGLE